MTNPMKLDVKCEDFLTDNPHLYACKARRKKIALISLEVANQHSEDVRVILKESKLIVGQQSHNVESPALITRKLSEFTWDFVIYSIVDSHPVLAVVDVFFFLTGPLYNRRLKKQLNLLSDGELLLPAGDRKKCVLGFRGVPKGGGRLQFSWCVGNGERQLVQCGIRQAPA